MPNVAVMNRISELTPDFFDLTLAAYPDFVIEISPSYQQHHGDLIPRATHYAGLLAWSDYTLLQDHQPWVGVPQHPLDHRMMALGIPEII